MIFRKKSELTNTEQRQVDLITKDGKGKLIAFVILYAGLFALFSFHFEVKLLNILSSSSMIDQSDTLSTIDRIFIKRKADKLYEKFGLPFRFLITNSPLTLSNTEQKTFYIAIQNKTNNAIVHLPQSLNSFQAKTDFSLRKCINVNENNEVDYAQCLEKSLEQLTHDMEVGNIQKINPKGFNLFQPENNF